MSTAAKSNKQLSSVQNFSFIPGEIATPRQIYIDGFSDVMFGPANCKISVYQVVGVDQDKNPPEERRQVVSMAVVPTAALVEFCATVLSSFASGASEIDKSLMDWRQKILNPQPIKQP